MFVFGQIGCIRAKVVVLGQNRSIPSKWLYSGRNVVVGQSGYIVNGLNPGVSVVRVV